MKIYQASCDETDLKVISGSFTFPEDFTILNFFLKLKD